MTLDTTWWLTNDAPPIPVAPVPIVPSRVRPSWIRPSVFMQRTIAAFVVPPLRPVMVPPPLSPNRRALRPQPHYPPRWMFRHVPVPIAPILFRGFPWSQVLFADGLRFYLTGAASDGGSQEDVDASLGNYRSSTEASRVGTLSVPSLPGISIVQASRFNGNDGETGSIQAVTNDKLKYTAPDSSTPGNPVYIANGETKTLFDGADGSKFVRVTRTSATDFAGIGVVEFTDQLNNVFGMANAGNSESTGGGNRYRAIILRNEDLIDISSIKAWVPVLSLGSVAVSSSAQLGGAGSGTVGGTTYAFCGWPARGWARIEQSGGTLREIVYYSSRTDSVLTVPSLGRGRLGTSAGAGAATDNIYPVPGIRIAHEAPSPLTGPIQTIANESTAPSGVSWSTARTAATGINVGRLYKNQGAGLWIHRELPAGIDATSKAWSQIGVQFSSGGITYTETLAGLYRIAVTARARYELHVGVGSPPDLSDTPDETFTSLPHTTTLTLAPSTVNYLVVNRRNQYDLVSEYDQYTIIDINGAGAERTIVPTAPEVQSWVASSGGTFRAQAIYAYSVDDSPADTWLIYTRFNGTDPDPLIDTPTTSSIVIAGPVAFLDWTSAAQANGTNGRILVRVRRSSDSRDSTNTDIYSATATTTGPAAPSGTVHYRRVAEQT